MCAAALHPQRIRQFSRLVAIGLTDSWLLRRAGTLPVKKRRKLERGLDPLKGGFVRAPKRGDNEPLTAAEAAAEEAGRKAARKAAKKAGPAPLPKRNVRKKR